MARACRAFKFVPLVELVSPSPRARDGACTCWDPRAVELSSLPLVGLLVSACACGVCRSVRSWQVNHGSGVEVALAACCIVSSTHASLNLFGVRRLFFSFLFFGRRHAASSGCVKAPGACSGYFFTIHSGFREPAAPLLLPCSKGAPGYAPLCTIRLALHCTCVTALADTFVHPR